MDTIAMSNNQVKKLNGRDRTRVLSNPPCLRSKE
jgi:hypothetical protein